MWGEIHTFSSTFLSLYFKFRFPEKIFLIKIPAVLSEQLCVVYCLGQEISCIWWLICVYLMFAVGIMLFRHSFLAFSIISESLGSCLASRIEGVLGVFSMCWNHALNTYGFSSCSILPSLANAKSAHLSDYNYCSFCLSDFFFFLSVWGPSIASLFVSSFFLLPINDHICWWPSQGPFLPVSGCRSIFVQRKL